GREVERRVGAALERPSLDRVTEQPADGIVETFGLDEPVALRDADLGDGPVDGRDDDPLGPVDGAGAGRQRPGEEVVEALERLHRPVELRQIRAGDPREAAVDGAAQGPWHSATRD